MPWLKSIAVVIFFIDFGMILFCQGNEITLGVCSNTVMVLTKEEMKREIREQVKATLAGANNEQERCNCRCNINNTDIQEMSKNLTEAMEDLLSPVMN